MNPEREALREELSAMLDGAVPAARRRELEKLLETDAELRREYEELRATVRLVRSLPPVSAPPELRARLRIARPRGRLLRFSPWWTLAAAAAGVVMAVLVRRPGVEPQEGGDRVVEAVAERAQRGEAGDDATEESLVRHLREPAEAAPAPAAERQATEEKEEAAPAPTDEPQSTRAEADAAPPPEPQPGAPAVPTRPRDEARGKSAPAEARDGEGKSSAAPAGVPRPEPTPWTARVLAGERPGSRHERALYLQELEHGGEEQLREHLARLAEHGRRGAQPTPPRRDAGSSLAQGAPPIAGDVRLQDRFEAMRIRGLLVRLYPRPEREGAREGATARLGATEQTVVVDVQLSPRELTGVLALFDVLDPDRLAKTRVRPRATAEEAPASPAAGVEPGRAAKSRSGDDETAAEVAAADLRRPVRLMLDFGPQPEEEAEAGSPVPGDGGR